MILKQCYVVGTSFLKHLGWNDLGVHSRQVRCAVNYQHILELLGISLPAAFFWSTNFYQFAGRNFDQFSILAFHSSIQFCIMLLTECMCILKWIRTLLSFQWRLYYYQGFSFFRKYYWVLVLLETFMVLGMYECLRMVSRNCASYIWYEIVWKMTYVFVKVPQEWLYWRWIWIDLQ